MSEILRACCRRKVMVPLVLALGLVSVSRSARANVYATNIKLNGGTTNLVAPSGQSITISYVLNEPASLGVTIDVSSGGNVVRRISLPPGDPATTRGLNTVIWDGLDNLSHGVPSGTYLIRITPSSSGYTNWTHLTSDTDPNTFVWDGRGIAVNRNPGSQFFGRIFVANATTGNDPLDTPGDVLGVLKFNADSSGAEEGIASDGGFAWADNGLGPTKIAVSETDTVYVDDLGTGGQVLSFDPTISTNSLVTVLSDTNRPPAARLTGMAITAQGTNSLLWMTDDTSTNGVLRWALTNGVCAEGDLGVSVVGIGNGETSLTVPPSDAAVDQNGNIYVCQAVTAAGDAAPRVFRFPAYDPSTNGGTPELTAAWAVGGADDFYGGASGIAVDPSGKYVAVAFQGIVDFTGFSVNGNTKVLDAASGALVANIDLDLDIGGSSTHLDTACAWDAVGNLYYIDNLPGRWRAVSPPGTNQTTTIAPATVQIVGGSVAEPVINTIAVLNGVVTIVFTGSAGDTTGSFVVLSAPSVLGPFSIVSSATITQTGAGLFQATLPASAGVAFYRIQRGTSPTPQRPLISRLTVSAGTVAITFTGSSSDSANAFVLMGSSTAGGTYSDMASAQITQLSPGSFRATAPANGPIQFYRIKR